MIDYIDTPANLLDTYQPFCPGPHEGELNPYQQVFVDNADKVTTMTIVSTNLGEPQHSTIDFHTGCWRSVPQLYSLDPGLDFLVVSTTQGMVYFQIRGVQVGVSDKPPSDAIANRLITTQPTALTPIEAMPSPQPTAQNTAEEDSPSSPTPTEAQTKKFCTQCGESFQPQDKYCAYCGHQIS